MKLKLHSVIVVAVCLCIAAGIHFTQEFRFYNIESNDLFLYDWADIWNRMQKTGGVAALIASFLTQFMRIPFAGCVITSAIYVLAAFLLYKSLSCMTKTKSMVGFSLLPSAFLFLCMENDYYRFQGHIAFVIILAALYAYVSVDKSKLRYVLGVLLIPVLFYIAGSVAIVFAVSAFVYEIVAYGLKGLKALAYPLVFFATAWISVKMSVVSSWEHAVSPFMYYDWPSTYYFPIYAWSIVPILILAAWVVSRMDMKSSFIKVFIGAGVVFSFFVAGNLYSQVHNKSFYRLIQEQYWAENEDWDQIIRTADRRQPTFLVSYLNLALAQKGLLLQNFKYYNPQDLSSLMYPTPNLKTGLSLQSTVYQAWGYLGSARKAAFDGNVVTPGSNHPRKLQALVRINTVLGAYDVAEKYINILDKTLFYHGWAESMRVFLYNPEAVRSDKVLGMMYASLPLTDEYARYDGIVGDMRDIHEACPENMILSQFYELYKILEEAQ